MRFRQELRSDGALAGYYIPAGEIYNGYDVTGQVTLAAANQPTLTYPLTLHEEPPESVSLTYEQINARKDPMTVLRWVGWVLGAETSNALLQWFGKGVKR